MVTFVICRDFFLSSSVIIFLVYASEFNGCLILSCVSNNRKILLVSTLNKSGGIFKRRKIGERSHSKVTSGVAGERDRVSKLTF